MCGTVALIHAVVNGFVLGWLRCLQQNFFYSRIESLELGDCPLKSFLEKVKDLEPEERGNKLSENEAIIAANNEVRMVLRWVLFTNDNGPTIMRCFSRLI